MDRLHRTHPWIMVPVNPDEPLVMHVDMNSCFATMEQQANRLLRGRPVGVAAYDTLYGCILSPSYEAKACGVKTGMRVWEAQALCPDIVIIQSHPPLYRDAHMRFRRILESYTADVTPKSIDEAVLDFRKPDATRTKDLETIAYEIKQRIHDEMGEWVRVNIGLSTNRFLAKTAAGLHKPDGFDTITKANLTDIYAGLQLLDITGINRRNKARLNLAGILTPLEFYEAPLWKLRHEVFQSIVGYYWYLKLRGWEIEDYDSRRQSIGHDYALQERTNSLEKLAKIIMKLCEKTGRRLRHNNYAAEGIQVWLQYEDGDFWHHGMHTHTRLYTTQQIYAYAMHIISMLGDIRVVTKISIAVFNLVPYQPEQLGLFDGVHGDAKALARSLDAINDRYGDMTIGSALLANMHGVVLDRVPFGSIKDLLDLYH